MKFSFKLFDAHQQIYAVCARCHLRPKNFYDKNIEYYIRCVCVGFEIPKSFKLGATDL